MMTSALTRSIGHITKTVGALPGDGRCGVRQDLRLLLSLRSPALTLGACMRSGQIFPGLKEYLGFPGDSSVQAASFFDAISFLR